MDILKCGNWDQETYAPEFTISMNGFRRREIPNIIVLASPYGKLKCLVETHIEMSIAIRNAIEEGKITPVRCWNPHAIA